MAGPYIFIHSGVPGVVAELPRYTKPNQLGVLGRFWEHMHAFDAHHRYEYRVDQAPRCGFLRKILANTVYNPIVPLEGDWHECSSFKLPEIVVLVEAGLQHDDDIIQQWFGADQVLALLSAATSFTEMVLAVECVCGSHECDAAAARYVEQVLGTAT